LRRRVAGLHFASDGRSLFTAGWDTAVKRWSVDGPDLATRFDARGAPQVCFDPESPHLLWVGAGDGTLALYDSRTGEELHTADAHQGGVSAIALAPAAHTVATAGRDRHLRLWKRTGRRLVQVADIVHETAVTSVALSPDGTRVAAYDGRDTVVLWSAEAKG